MTDPEQLRAEDVWRWEGRSYPEVAAELGIERGALQRRALDLGFSRSPGGGNSADGAYREGPCLICLEPCAREELDDDLQCPECAHDEHAGPYHVHRWGHQPPEGDDAHPDWLVLERLARDVRTERDAQRIEALKPIRFEVTGEDPDS